MPVVRKGGWLALAAMLLAACQPAAGAPGPTSGAGRPATAPATAGAAVPASAPALAAIKITFASHGASYAPFHIAIDNGYFLEEGLEVEAVNAGGGMATPALITGEVQYSTSAASALSAILKGAPLKVIFTNLDRPGYELWSTTPEVQTVPDLVGRTLGILTRGDSSEIAVRILLAQRGVDPNTIAFTAIGGSAQTLAAAQGGLVAAVTLGTDVSVQYAASGPKGRQIANLKREVQMVYMGLTTTDRELTEHRDRARRVLRATLKGREYYRAFKEETLEIVARHNGGSREGNEADYEDVLQSLTADGSVSLEVQQRDTAVRAELSNVEAIPPMERMYDYSLVQEVDRELRASGWRPQR